MPKKEDLLRKLLSKPTPTNFTTRELDALMKKCGCKKFEGGRGSGIGFVHEATKPVIEWSRLIDVKIRYNAAVHIRQDTVFLQNGDPVIPEFEVNGVCIIKYVLLD